MKLTKCYIENFGKLHQYTLTFNDTLTIIQEGNGFGKTTLAVFIKAMLYGFPKASKTLERNERKKYQPWQGGTYGGFLEFEYNNISYRVERTFGLSPKEDHFQLYHLNPLAPCNDFSDNIGMEILGISSESYEKSTYLPQVCWTTDHTTKELKDTLINIAANTSDISSYEKGIKSLRKRRNELMPYRGKDGIVYKQTSEISKLEYRLNELKTAKKKLEETKNQLLLSEKQMQQLERERILSFECMNTENEIQQIQSKYAYGFPTDQELKECKKSLLNSESIQSNNANISELNELSDFFYFSVPGKTEMDEYDYIADEIIKARALMQNTSHEAKKRKKSLFYTSLFTLFMLILSALLFIKYNHSNIGSINSTPLIVVACILFFILLFFIGQIIHKSFHSIRLRRNINEQRNIILSLENALREEMFEFDLCYSDPIESLETLKKYRNKYLNLRKLADSTNQMQQDTELSSYIQIILDRYHLSHLSTNEESIEIIAADKNSLRKLLLKKHALNSQLKAHLEGIFPSSDSFFSDLQKNTPYAIINKIEETQEKIIRFHKEIALLQNECEKIPSFESKLETLRNEQSDTLKQIELLDKAIKHLQTAYESLTTNFVPQLEKRFIHYLKLLSSIPYEQVYVNADTSVSIERFGIQRSSAYFSVGEMDVIALCMRFAIVDLLYPNQKPILILDDPFVNLDQDNLSSALAVLREISQTQQILYLTCHNSRT